MPTSIIKKTNQTGGNISIEPVTIIGKPKIKIVIGAIIPATENDIKMVNNVKYIIPKGSFNSI